MVKLRLKRFGKKGKPTFRIIAIHSTTRRQAIPLEELGFYDPRTKETRLDVEGIKRRLSQGAQPTDPVRRLLEKANILEPIARG
ncbi:MAG: 30S ribosomal protein S16 [Pseudanabaenaceae cyanobacterium SKYGB_i_bin29]|nr:30S ribosomal protein S16 [Pseudanabaenaceae cyanobacterium SKYG29]MDW8422520.1 30S ribosomal protein S16 [Pseudanabaenaceae cyanobacterium SKYGB_i_bin29]